MRAKLLVSVFALLMLVATSVSAFELESSELKVDGDIIDEGTTNILNLERGDSITVKYKFTTKADMPDLDHVSVRATIDGTEHDNEKLSDVTDVFDIQGGVTYIKTLKLDVPTRTDNDEYYLRIYVNARNDQAEPEVYRLQIDEERNKVVVKDISLSPEGQVEAGRALLVTAKVKNYGERDENDGVKIIASIPELGLQASEFIDELDIDESTTSEELYFRIPACARAGPYQLLVMAEYDDGEEQTQSSRMIHVVPGNMCDQQPSAPNNQPEQKTVIAINTETQTVQVGTNGAIYPVTITNMGSTAKTYVLTSAAPQGLDVVFSPGNVVVLNSGESKAVYTHVSADRGDGEQTFGLSITSGEKTLKEILLKAEVVGEEESSSAKAKSSWSVKTALEIGLVVLVVLLVVLGLIIGFNRLKNDDDYDEPGEGQTYY